MKTVNLNEESPSLSELLSIAREDSVLIFSKEGTKFVLEEAEDFEREVAELGKSERFTAFLAKRAKEKGSVPIERFIEGLAD